MPILTLLAPLISWIFREVVFKFVLFGVLFAAMALFVPWILELVSPFIGTSSLTALFANVPPGMWYFWDMANLGFGLPLMISAYVARFIIRRIPFFG